MWEWLYYNFAAGRFHTKKICSRVYSIKIEFYSKNKKALFEPPFGYLGVTYALHLLARWKARGRLPICHH